MITHSISEIVEERGGYSYTIEGEKPCRCWSLHKPDLKKLNKTLERLNHAKLRVFNARQKKEAKKS